MQSESPNVHEITWRRIQTQISPLGQVLINGASDQQADDEESNDSAYTKKSSF